MSWLGGGGGGGSSNARDALFAPPRGSSQRPAAGGLPSGSGRPLPPHPPASSGGGYSQPPPQASVYNRPQPPSLQPAPTPPPYNNQNARGGYPQEKTSYGGSGGGGVGGSKFVVAPGPEQWRSSVDAQRAFATANCVWVNPGNWSSRGGAWSRKTADGFGEEVIDYGQMQVYDKAYGVTVRLDDSIPFTSPPSVCLSRDHQMWLGVSEDMKSPIELVPISQNDVSPATSLDLEIKFRKEGQMAQRPIYDVDQLSKEFVGTFDGKMFTRGHDIVLFSKNELLKARIISLETLDTRGGAAGRSSPWGVISPGTSITIRQAPGSKIELKASATKANPKSIIRPDFKFEDLGIGGLDKEFGDIFRRAFASRIFPTGLVEKLGIQHVKGLLLYGPPGTGKTLIARQIGKMLNAKEPKIVNGPEILNKFVGQSEENIRKLFEDAEKEYKQKGDQSDLHIIIFDELDAICKQRGSTGGGTGVGDSVVNQLLSKMDGVNALNNILIIGMTNRLDMIDEALLRPGRLEVHMEISLPDEAGRIQILNIHTSKMRASNTMADDVNINILASETKNFSGAEISGLVKSATSFAFNRHIKVGTTAGISDDVEKLKVTMADFEGALKEIQPAFGVAEDELKNAIPNGIIHFAGHIEKILFDGRLFVEQVRTSARTPLVSILIHGPPGSGKTALAASIATDSGFPFIKLISPDDMVGMNEAARIDLLKRTFSNSYKSPLSVIVVDNIERIIEWVPIGPRFSNGILQALMVLTSKRPAKAGRLLIIATTSNRPMLDDTEMSEVFAADIRVPAITSIEELLLVIKDVNLFESPEDFRGFHSTLVQANPSINVGVKKLLSLIEMARQSEDVGAKLLGVLVEQGYVKPGAQGGGPRDSFIDGYAQAM